VGLRDARPRHRGGGAGQRQLDARAEDHRGVHARGPALHRAVGPLVAVRAGRLAARPPDARSGREALLRRGQRGDGRVHRVLGSEALLRHEPPVLVGAHVLQGEGDRRVGRPGQRRGEDAGRALASLLARRLLDAAVPRLHVGARDRERRGVADARALHRQRPLRGRGDPVGGLDDGAGCQHCADAGAERDARDGRSRIEGSAALPAELHGHRGDGGGVSSVGRVPHPDGQRGRVDPRATHRDVQLAEVPGLLRGQEPPRGGVSSPEPAIPSRGRSTRGGLAPGRACRFPPNRASSTASTSRAGNRRSRW